MPAGTLDFFEVFEKEGRNNTIEVYPEFIVRRSTDLMVRGKDFYAVWVPEKGLWSTDTYDVREIVDKALYEHADKLRETGVKVKVKPLGVYSNGGWNQFNKYCKSIGDNSRQLDAKLTFANTEVTKKDHVSRRLPYALAPGDHSAWDELVSVLYSPTELEKIEWAIGSIVAGDSKKIEKFLVFFGPGGTGKSTVMKIIEKLFEGYVAMFEAAALVGRSNAFATEVFKNNPLVAIQHDGDLSKIEDNSKLNSVVGHDKMVINEKFKAGYESKLHAFLFMGTNKAVKITDSKSGLIRRLIDVQPTRQKHDPNRYFQLMHRIEFELGAIAQHCLEVYQRLGKNYYNAYQPLEMMFKTDPFFNYVEANYEVFSRQDGCALKQAWELWKTYAADAELGFKMTMYKFREQLKDYFDEFYDRIDIDGVTVRSYYSKFNANKFKTTVGGDVKTFALVLEEVVSLLDKECADLPAQYGTAAGVPSMKWDNVRSTLADISTGDLHYLKVPENHIVIDFDLKDENGEKSLELNLQAASEWPPTYAEISQGGNGVHLHYYTDLDTSELASEFSEGIEIKVYRGGSALRRRLSKCNNVPIATINTGLPFKEKKMIPPDMRRTERMIREQIQRNLRKEVHSSTVSSVSMIKKILDDAYESGMVYDVSDMRQAVLAFANNSSNQALNCLRMFKQMKFKSEATIEEAEIKSPSGNGRDNRRVIFDVEVYPNLFVICWSYEDSDTVVPMINPTPEQVQQLIDTYLLVGFNNRGYDNHMLYAAAMGASNEQLYEISQRIINGKNNDGKFGAAYGLSYADIYDYSAVKKRLKVWQIDLRIHHMEMNIPWDQPVPPEMWDKVVEYCTNDVVSTKRVMEACENDFVARQILADLSGMTVNDPTRMHCIKIIFGNNRQPQSQFVYTDLSEMFPGYKFDQYAKAEDGKSTYRGESVGEGGYVYAEPGYYENVALLDVASMHPTSIRELNLFGNYTEKFNELMDTRLAVKRMNLREAREAFGGKISKHVDNIGLITDPEKQKQAAGQLEQALKLVINSIYGYTAAKFDNPFRDPRNIDNIVAKRGALFMVDLKHALQERGVKLVHIKTDSVKIANATLEDIEFVKEFGRHYGYDFEHEATYKKMVLVNDAVYIARVGWTAKKGECDYWTATGAEFKHPVVFKALFSQESINFDDLCETKSVKAPSAMYLDFDESEATPATPYKGMYFVGRTGRFVPVRPSSGGAKLVKSKDDKFYAVQGTNGYLWLEAEMVEFFGLNQIDRMLFEDATFVVNEEGTIWDIVDSDYYENLVEDAVESISKFVPYAELVK